MKYFLTFFFILIIQFESVAQKNSNNKKIEDSLIIKIKLLSQCNDDLCLEGRNQDFRAELLQFIHSGEAFKYPFNHLKKSVGIIDSPDKKIRLITWNTIDFKNNYHYYCFVLYKDNSKNKEYNIIELKDYSKRLSRIENKTLTEHKWFGALYFDVLPVQKNKKTYYTLLGWDGNNTFTDKKIIDVLSINGNRASFGYPIFKLENKIQNRFIIEYKSESYCSLKFEGKHHFILFDKMQPINPEAEGIYEFYMSLGLLSSFDWDKKNELWVLTDEYKIEEK